MPEEAAKLGSGPRHWNGAIVLLAGLALLAGCAWPTYDPWKLAAIRDESRQLMVEFPAKTQVDVPKARWPRAIARLEPEIVWVSEDGVDILVKPYFDGGWGYFVPRDERWRPDPEGRYSEMRRGIYWYHPY